MHFAQQDVWDPGSEELQLFQLLLLEVFHPQLIPSCCPSTMASFCGPTSIEHTSNFKLMLWNLWTCRLTRLRYTVSYIILHKMLKMNENERCDGSYYNRLQLRLWDKEIIPTPAWRISATVQDCVGWFVNTTTCSVVEMPTRKLISTSHHIQFSGVVWYVVSLVILSDIQCLR